MRLPLLAAASLFVALTAGCVGSPGDPISMHEGLGDAREAAKAWGASPQLVGAFAVEPFKHLRDTNEDGELQGEFVTHLDGNAGDGRAPGWAYVFYSEEAGRCIFVALAGGLGVLAEGWEECGGVDEEDETPFVIPGEVLDSDRIAGILAGNEDWPQADDASLAGWELEMEDGQPHWGVFLSNETLSAYAVVDGLTGDVLELEFDDGQDGGFDDGLVGEDGVASASSGTYAWGSAPAVTAATPLILEIELQGDEAVMSIQAAIATSAVGQATLRVVGPEGEVFEEAFAGSQSFVLEALPEGDYEVRIEHGNVALSPALRVDAWWAE